MNIVFSKKNLVKAPGKTLVIFAAVDDKKNVVVEKSCRALIPEPALDDFREKKHYKIILYPPWKKDETGPGIDRIFLVRLLPLAESKTLAERLEQYRIAGGDTVKLCKIAGNNELSVVIPSSLVDDEKNFVEGFLEGLILGGYDFLKYKTKENDHHQGLLKTVFIGAKNSKKAREAADRAVVASRAGCRARDMANEPGNGWTPSHFAELGQSLAEKYPLRCEVFGKKQLAKLGMGGLLAVNQGSHEEPKLVCLDYKPTGAKSTIVLVGKGLTFDSGGVSLKPAAKMMEMKYDMCGGAAVIAAMEAIAVEKPGVRVIGLIPSTDNMAGGGALKPGDIITHYGGQTSEIENTDAEGRLILADALAYGIEKYSPDYIVDIATLTGAVIIALGHHHSGIMGSDQFLVDLAIKAGERAGEPIWQLPLGKNYAKQLKSAVADFKNMGGRAGGSIVAAEYLHKFTGETPWVHLDIAGTAWDFTDKSYIPKGPSGVGSRTLLELVRSLGSR